MTDMWIDIFLICVVLFALFLIVQFGWAVLYMMRHDRLMARERKRREKVSNETLHPMHDSEPRRWV